MRPRWVVLLAFAVLGAGAVAAAAASAAHLGGNPSRPAIARHGVVVTIGHEACGCHTLDLAGERATFHAIRLGNGARLTVVNRDFASHELVEVSGPAVTMTSLVPRPHYGPGLDGTFGRGVMAHWRSGIRVSFSGPGVYRFVTREGDHFNHGTSLGPDNALSFDVVVGATGLNHGWGL